MILERLFMMRYRFSISVLVLCLVTLHSSSVKADIYQWQWIDPSNESLGREASGDLAPDGAGRLAVPGVDFASDNLTKAWLPRVDLTGADLRRTNLSNADLSGANLTGARMFEARLQDAYLTDAIINGAFMERTTSRGLTQEQFYSTASYRNRDLSGLWFRGNDVSGWDFSGFNLRGVNLDANITGTSFTNATINDVRFSGILTATQLYSTASYQSGDLSGVQMPYVNATGWDLAGKNLKRVDLRSANLTNIVITDADIRNARFGYAGGPSSVYLSESQFYSTASYKSGDLEGIELQSMDLDGWNFENKRLVEGSFFRARIAGASFTGAIIRGVEFSYSDVTEQQIVSTASYANRDLRGVQILDHDLSGWDFSNQDLRGAELSLSNLTGTDFTGADIRGITISHPESSSLFGLKVDQLYSTASYQQRDLTGVAIGTTDMTNWDLSRQDLAGADFTGYDDGPYTLLANTDLRNANLTDTFFRYVTFDEPQFRHADFRGAFVGFVPPETIVPEDSIRPDGTVELLIAASGESLRLWDYNPEQPLPISVLQDLRIDSNGELRIVIEDDVWGSTISVEPSATITLGGTLHLDVETADGVAASSLVGATFQLFDWGDTPTTERFDEIVFEPGYLWDTSQLYDEGTVALLAVPIPEPSICLLALQGIMSMIGFHRRR